MSQLVNRNPAPASPRYSFQWKYVMQFAPSVLNIGCSNDPLCFREYAHHFDYDDWAYQHERFTQGDAHKVDLAFEPQAFDLVVMADIHEHLVNPLEATLAAAQVTRQVLVMTIFEEWRLPGPGQWIAQGHDASNIESQRQGYASTEHYQQVNFPRRRNGGDLSHLEHINQFTDEEIAHMVNTVCRLGGFEILEFFKQPEQQVDGHVWSNWLIALKRLANSVGTPPEVTHG